MNYNRIALTRELPGDLDTPVGAYLKLAHKPYSFLLESMVGGEQWGRYSFIGLPSREVLRVRGTMLTVERDGETIESANRSEEHTSELQSLMRNSYAVFCLKNKKQNIF